MTNLLNHLTISLWKDSAIQNNEILASLIEEKGKARILEVGTYDGSWIIERVKKIKNPEIYGIDVDEQSLKLSSAKGIKVIKANADDPLPFKSGFFDVVSANQIIEHLTNVDGFVKEVHRVLKPKGYLVLSTENLSSWHNIFALLLGWQAFSQHISRKLNIGNPLRIHPERKNLRSTSGMHIKIFTPRGLTDLVKLYGFKIEKFYGAGYYPFFYPLSRLFSRLDPIHSVFIGLKAKKIK